MDYDVTVPQQLPVTCQDDGSSEKITYEINLELLDDLWKRGIRRAYVFLGIGLNSVDQNHPQDIHLPHNPEEAIQIAVLPDITSPDQLERHKKDFNSWIIGNALRELIEFFSFFLDEVYHAALLSRPESLDENELSNSMRSFESKGPIDKLISLEKEGIRTGFKDVLKSINRARNCLTHRSGVVGKGYRGSDDLNEHEELVIYWKFYERFILLKDGNEIPWPAGQEITIQGVAEPCMKVIDRSKTFKKLELLQLSSRDLLEIILNFHNASKEILEDLQSKMVEKGIWPNEVSPIPSATIEPVWDDL